MVSSKLIMLSRSSGLVDYCLGMQTSSGRQLAELQVAGEFKPERCSLLDLNYDRCNWHASALEVCCHCPWLIG
ncbi:hypothetical protein WJX79_000591 [Trebouxia sp. C0005]